MIQETDAVVIGAGPVGLFQVFQLGLQGLSAHIIDALPYAGGQCVELYGDKPIYDIPGVPMCTGRELAALLQQQITAVFSHGIIHRLKIIQINGNNSALTRGRHFLQQMQQIRTIRQPCQIIIKSQPP